MLIDSAGESSRREGNRQSANFGISHAARALSHDRESEEEKEERKEEYKDSALSQVLNSRNVS
jgi:hypothetical protein